LTLVATIGLLAEPLGSILFASAAWLTEWVYLALSSLAELDWSSFEFPELGIGALSLLFAGSACALPAHALPARYLGWIAMLSALVTSPPRPPPGGAYARVLDVGHGLAVVVQTNTHALLYDTGARYRSGFDTGRDVILPTMKRLGIDRLDSILVSHADNDHAGGLDSVLGAFPDALLVAGPDLEHRNATRCLSGDQWLWDGVVFEILHPPRDFPVEGNDSSCVLRISSAGRALLLTGDIEERGERSLLTDNSDIAADVVVIPHHGSATSSSLNFIQGVGARVAIVSAAYANRWGFPRPEVVGRWQQAGAELIVTGNSGAIRLVIDPNQRLSLTTERSRWRRPWSFDANR
jgi:competence protein ComEC